MSADEIIFYFSIFVGVRVIFWAYYMISEYNKVGKD